MRENSSLFWVKNSAKPSRKCLLIEVVLMIRPLIILLMLQKNFFKKKLVIFFSHQLTCFKGKGGWTTKSWLLERRNPEWERIGLTEVKSFQTWNNWFELVKSRALERYFTGARALFRKSHKYKQPIAYFYLLHTTVQIAIYFTLGQQTI